MNVDCLLVANYYEHVRFQEKENLEKSLQIICLQKEFSQSLLIVELCEMHHLEMNYRHQNNRNHMEVNKYKMHHRMQMDWN